MKHNKWDTAALWFYGAMVPYWAAWAIFHLSTGHTEKAFDQTLLASAWLSLTLLQGVHRNNKTTIRLQNKTIQSLTKQLGRDGR